MFNMYLLNEQQLTNSYLKLSNLITDYVSIQYSETTRVLFFSVIMEQLSSVSNSF